MEKTAIKKLVHPDKTYIINAVKNDPMYYFPFLSILCELNIEKNVILNPTREQ